MVVLYYCWSESIYANKAKAQKYGVSREIFGKNSALPIPFYKQSIVVRLGSIIDCNGSMSSSLTVDFVAITTQSDEARDPASDVTNSSDV